MAQHHPSPPMAMQMHHGPPGPPAPAGPPGGAWSASRQILVMNEGVWLQIGSFSEVLNNLEDAIMAYEQALRANPQSVQAMNAISLILRTREDFPKAVEYLQAILKIDNSNGEAWGSLGHCFLMMDDLQQAYAAYQSALVNLRNPKEPRLWYGIGILYDRYGSLDHAEEAFSNVMQMQPDFEKANEIYFRLGIIYKQQAKYNQSLECFKYIVNSPPHPLTEEDIWFQIGHVHEQQKDYDSAKNAYMRVLEREPTHAKVLQQLGWLFHQQNPSFSSQETAIEYLEKSVAADNNDAQSWYLLGRCYMSQQKYPKAYEAYQQAVYRDGRNPTFWCSIGVLYYQINQYRDALDAYSRAIRLNPFISEVWYDLGTLYESCNNQISDALDAYQRAAELDPNNPHIKARLQLLRHGGANGAPAGQAPTPTDIHPQAYQANGPPGPQWAGSGSGAGQVQQPPPNGGPAMPAMPTNGGGWRLSDVNPRLSDVNPHAPQPPNPYEREQYRNAPMRPLSPRPEPQQLRPEQLRPYQDPARGAGGPPIHRGPSPLPPTQYAPPPPPPPQQVQQQGPPPPTSQGPPHRMINPAVYGPPGLSSGGPGPGLPGPMSSSNGLGGPPGPKPPVPPYRTSSPRNDGKAPHERENRMPSPKSAYPQHHHAYQPHPDQAGPSNMDSNGPPPPPAPLGQDIGMHRESEHRPPSVGPKRMREWEDEPSVKKQASDENRARLEEMRHRRPSTPPREPYRRSSSEARHFEDQRRMEDQRRAEAERRELEMRRPEVHRHVSDNYHPSDAAHHPPAHSAPPPPHISQMQQGGPSQMQNLIHDGPQPQPPPAGPASGPKDYGPSIDERQRGEPQPPVAPRPPSVNEPERAARKMEISDNYDDEEPDDKRPAPPGPGSAPGDLRTSTPTSAGINGMLGSSKDGA